MNNVNLNWNEASYASLINEANNNILPSLPSQAEIDKFNKIKSSLEWKRPHEEFYLIFIDKNDKCFCFLGKTGCATCGNDAENFGDLRIFKNFDHFLEFSKIDKNDLKEEKIDGFNVLNDNIFLVKEKEYCYEKENPGFSTIKINNIETNISCFEYFNEILYFFINSNQEIEIKKLFIPSYVERIDISPFTYKVSNNKIFDPVKEDILLPFLYQIKSEDVFHSTKDLHVSDDSKRFFSSQKGEIFSFRDMNLNLYEENIKLLKRYTFDFKGKCYVFFNFYNKLTLISANFCDVHLLKNNLSFFQNSKKLREVTIEDALLEIERVKETISKYEPSKSQIRKYGQENSIKNYKNEVERVVSSINEFIDVLKKI